MKQNDEYLSLVPRFESLLADLDRLNFPTVAVHVDFALRLFEQKIGVAPPELHE